MFLVRSIRRRLVLLFAIALLLMVGLAGIGIGGLIWHQEAVDNLDFLLHRSPNRDHLSRSVARISETLFQNYDLRRQDSINELRRAYTEEVTRARADLSEFLKRVNTVPPITDQPLQERRQTVTRLQKVYDELKSLHAQAGEFEVVRTAEQQAAMESRRFRIAATVARVQKTLETLQSHHADWGEHSLNMERSRSALLLKILIYGTAIVAVIFITILIYGLQTISGPVRIIARECTRIANGDTAHRLRMVCRWQDEFADVMASVNCMADRFQQAEEELQFKVRERSEQLVRSQRLANVGFLAAGVAHEINNPLSAISMAAESLEFRLYELIGIQSDESREVMDRVSMIRRESRRCGDITARLLNFSRGDCREKINVDISELIREVLVMVQHLGRYSDRSVIIEASRSVYAEVDPAQMKQVILNLVANGLQATEPGGQVLIALHEQVDTFTLTVSDDGCGMTSDTLQHIFDPFFTTQETGQGTGLGLCITHRIIQDHGGTVTPMSDGEGKGSCFRIRIPRRQMQAHAA